MAITEQLFRGVLKTHQALYERTNGRIGENLFGTKALLLRTKGRKSGQVRTAALTFSGDGERYLIVASKGGAPEPPAWFLNLRADPQPEIQVGRERSPATATIIESDDPDYERVWKIVNDGNSHRYEAYQRKTSRPIPVVALTRDK
jgi:deazaflavin-dependent oxidoreductase (nitroreductase family)